MGATKVTETHLDYQPDRVYQRDASWHDSIGKGTQFHWSRPDDPALAVCSRNIMVLSGGGPSGTEGYLLGEDPDAIAAVSRCMASGCKQRWAKWDEDAWYRVAVAKAATEWAKIKDDPHTGYSDTLVCDRCWAGDGDPRCQRCGCSVGFPGCQCTEGYLEGPCLGLAEL